MAVIEKDRLRAFEAKIQQCTSGDVCAFSTRLMCEENPHYHPFFVYQRIAKRITGSACVDVLGWLSQAEADAVIDGFIKTDINDIRKLVSSM